MGSVDIWVGYWGRLRPARPAIEMFGLCLQQSPYLESDGLVPLLGQQARVVDGELVLAGSAVTGDGWLRTGDLAVESRDGSLTILGRHG